MPIMLRVPIFVLLFVSSIVLSNIPEKMSTRKIQFHVTVAGDGIHHQTGNVTAGLLAGNVTRNSSILGISDQSSEHFRQCHSVFLFVSSIVLSN
jgi:hypothetical protein